jgi:integrase/recombinase XerD
MKNELVQNFKVNLEEDGKSIKTVESYVGDTSAFVAFLESKEVEFNGEMKRFYITSYRNYLIENQYELSTINKKVNSIQSFNKYLVDNGYTKDVVVDISKDRVKLAYGSERQVEVLKVFGKGGKVREVPLKLEVVEAINEYLVERSSNPFADSDYLIVGQRGVLQRDAINMMPQEE